MMNSRFLEMRFGQPTTFCAALLVCGYVVATAGCGSSGSAGSGGGAGAAAASGTGASVGTGGSAGNAGWSAPETMASAIAGPNVVAVDSERVYWGSDDGTVRSLPHAGGGETLLASGQDSPLDIDVDGGAVYWTAYQDGTVMKTDKNGGGTPVRLAENQDSPQQMDLDGTHVYWSMPSKDSVARVAKSGGAVEVLTTSATDAEGLTVDATNVYATLGSSGAIGALPLSGGAVVNLSTGWVYPSYLDSDDSVLFWSSGGSTIGDGRVVSSAKDGSNAKELVSGLRDPSHVVAHGSHVYFTDPDGGQVLRVPKAGGALDVIANGQATPSGIAVSPPYVYWCNNADGTLRRITGKGL